MILSVSNSKCIRLSRQRVNYLKNPTHSGLSGDCGETQLAVRLPIKSEIQQGTSMSTTTSSTRGASGSDAPISSVPVSKKMKLVLKHTLQPDQPDSRARDERRPSVNRQTTVGMDTFIFDSANATSLLLWNFIRYKLFDMWCSAGIGIGPSALPAVHS